MYQGHAASTEVARPAMQNCPMKARCSAEPERRLGQWVLHDSSHCMAIEDEAMGLLEETHDALPDAVAPFANVH